MRIRKNYVIFARSERTRKRNRFCRHRLFAGWIRSMIITGLFWSRLEKEIIRIS
jgi:hypothetical protein